MKKAFCLLVALLLIFLSFSPAASASEVREISSKSRVNKQYGYSYTECTGDNYSIIRMYSMTPDASPTPVDYMNTDDEFSTYDHTKALLGSLGMDPDFIEQLSHADLAEYGASEQIISVKSYLKADCKGSVISVEQEEAINAAILYAIIDEEIFDGDGGYPFWYKTQQTDDSYMEITLVISYKGNGRYKFSVDARWLTSPICTFEDSLGACAQNFAIENGTRSGWYMYDQITTLGGYELTFTDQKETISNFQNAEGQGNWDGSAMIVNLKDNAIVLESPTYDGTIYRNHRMHYEFEATIHQWQQETNFNATATYVHMQIAIQVTPTVSIGLTGASVSIGINPFGAKKRYLVELPNSIAHEP